MLAAATATVSGCGRTGPGARSDAPRLDLVIERRIGGEDMALSHVFRLAVGPKGFIAEVDGPPTRVLLIGPDGTSVASGSRGDGPSEYRSVTGLGFAGDTLWVADARSSRALFFELSGAFLGSGRVSAPAAAEGGSTAGPIGRLEDGSWLASRAGLCITCVLTGLTTARIYVRVADGVVRDTVFQQPLPRADFIDMPVGRWHIEGLGPLAQRPLLVRSGPGLWVVDRQSAKSAGPASFRLHRIDRTGDTVRSATIRYEPIAVTDAWKDAWCRDRTASAAGLPGVPSGKAEAACREAASFPAYFPPIADALAGTDGRLWLREGRPDARRAAWLVVDSLGHVEGRLAAPPGFRLLAADSGHVWGVLEDSMDVETIVRGRLRPGARDG